MNIPKLKKINKVGIIIIATNKYIKFFDNLYNSCERFLFPKCNKTYFLMSDKQSQDYENVVKIDILHEQWPNPTLKRFHYISDNKDKFKEMDYLVYIDVDCKLIRYVDENILPEHFNVVKHCGFYNTSNKRGTPETNKNSTAYISPKINFDYVAGGFFIGKTNLFLQMVEKLKKNIQIDLNNGIIAIWHDESHLNWYVVNHKFLFNYLTPEYCYPEGWGDRPNLFLLNGKIIALDKNHSEMRN